MLIHLFKFFIYLSKSFSYEPEINPGATYRFKEVSATLKIFQTGSITITAPSVDAVQSAVEHIYPLVFHFKKDKPLLKRVLTDNNLNEDNKLISVHRNKKRRKYADYSEEDEDLIDEEMSNDEGDDF